MRPCMHILVYNIPVYKYIIHFLLPFVCAARKFRKILTGNPVESSHPVMNYAVLAPLLADVRNEIRSKGIKLYNDHWQASITDELVNYINDGKYEIARKVLLNDLLEGIDCECSNNICKKYESKIEIAVALKKNSPKWK